MRRLTLGAGLLVATLCGLQAGEPSPEVAVRGRKAPLSRSFNPPAFSRKAYDEVWRQWGLKEKPKDCDHLFRERYGLHPAPYPNNGLPMGLRQASSLFGTGITTDCLACHGGSIAGQSYVGLGNASGDYQALLVELAAAEGRTKPLPFHFCRVRGTSEAAPWPSSCCRSHSRPEHAHTAPRPGTARRPVRGRSRLVAAQKEENDVPQRRRRCPLGALADAVHADAPQHAQRLRARGGHLPRRPGLPAQSEAASLSLRHRPHPGSPGRSSSTAPAPAVTALTATSRPIPTASCPWPRSAPIRRG